MQRLLFLALILFLTCAFAAPVTYTTRSSFLANPSVTSTVNINFDGYSTGTAITNQTISGATFNSPGGIPLQVIAGSTGVRYAMSPSTGANVLSPGGSNTSQQQDDLELVFSNPVKAVGLDVVFDVPDGAAYVAIYFYDASNNLIAQIAPHIPAPVGAPGYQFVGLVADSAIIARVLVDEWDDSANDDHVAYDSIVFTSPVPEPISFSLIFLGCLSILWVIRKK